MSLKTRRVPQRGNIIEEDYFNPLSELFNNQWLLGFRVYAPSHNCKEDLLLNCINKPNVELCRSM